MDKWTLFNKTNKSKLFVFINSFAVILLLTSFFAEKIFPGLKDTDIFMKGIWEIGLWVGTYYHVPKKTLCFNKGFMH